MRTAPFIAAALSLLGALGCGAESRQLRQDLNAMRAELQTMRQENGELNRRVELMSARLDSMALRSRSGTAPAPAAAQSNTAPAERTAQEPSVIVPPNLTVVRMGPSSRKAAHEIEPKVRRRGPPPPIPTAVPLQEPDSELLASLGTQPRELSAQAQSDLDAAMAASGLAGARALEDFTGRYPHHASADNALVEAAKRRAEAGEPDAACELYSRCVKEYPAGDTLPDALEQLGACYARSGRVERARQLLERVVVDFPDTPAAKRASERLSNSTSGGATSTTSRQGVVP